MDTQTLLETIVKQQKELSESIVAIKNDLKIVHTENITNSILDFQLMHQIKLKKLKQKIGNGLSIRVIFINAMLGQFGFDSIYNIMKNSSFFDPYILVISPWDNDFQKDNYIFEESKKSYEYFKSRGYNTFFAYDDQKNPYDISVFNPDIIFYNNPNLIHSANYYKNIKLNIDYLTCYITYAMNTLGDFQYNYENYWINTAWKNFSETKFSYLENINKSIYKGYNAVLSGFPKLDEYAQSKKEKLFQNDNITVIYAPHWSIKNKNKNLNLSTFHLFYKNFFEMVKKYKNINFIFKPHPLLPFHIKGLYKQEVIDLSLERYYEYINTFSQYDNFKYINHGEYINIFKSSDCLITDSGSFIAEWLPSKKPCIYILNPERNNNQEVCNDDFKFVNTFGKTILQTYYLCKNWTHVQKYLDDIISGIDPKQNDRRKVLENEFYNIGSAGKFICNYLLKCIFNS